MKEILYKRYKKYKKLIKAATCFIVFLCFSFFFQINQKPVNALNNRVIIPIKQEFETDDENVDGVFTYTLEAKDKDNPIPSNSNGTKYTWSMKNDSNINLSFDINKVGDFTYSINQDYQHDEELQDNQQDDEGHFIIDHHIYKLNIQSHYDKNNEIVATAVVRNQDGDKVSEIIFKNYYEIHSSTPSKRKPTNGNAPVNDENKQNQSNGKNVNQDSKNIFEMNSSTINQEQLNTAKHPNDKDSLTILKTGDSSLVDGYLCMFIISGVILLIMNHHSMKRKGDADND